MVDHADVIASIDATRFARIVERWSASADPEEERRQKYLDLDRWIPRNLRRAKTLGLDGGPRRRILDLGCGCGYFLYVCKLLGHDVIGIDRPERCSLFTEMRELLGVPWVPHAIQAFNPLPGVGQFDIVTAHMVTFNGHRSLKLWGVKEWAWLLDSLAPASVYLELNREPDRTLFMPGLREFFVERGATIAGHRIRFP